MKLTLDQIEKRLVSLEAVSTQSQRLQEEIRKMDVKAHVAEVYHSLHDDICEGKHEFYNLPGGRGSGKSSFVSLEVVYQIMADPSGLSNALVVRKWASALRGSVFSQIQWAIDQLGATQHWSSTLNPPQFIYETGQVIRLTGLDDPQKLRSLKPSKGYFRILWLEEFCELSGEPELRNLQQSVLRGGDNFLSFRSFNPPLSQKNWANEYINLPDPKSVKLLTNYLQIPVKWLGQPFIEEAERLKEINRRAYDHEYMGIPVGSGSEVFETLEIRKIPDEEIKSLDKIYQGLDFGFSKDPACFLRVSYSQKTETVWIIDEIYGIKMSNTDLVNQIKSRGYHLSGSEGYVSLWMGVSSESRQLIVADSAEPKSIDDMNGQGLKVIPCHKFQGCVEYRVRWLQHRKIVCDPERTPNTARELQNYSYKVDKRTGEVLSTLQEGDDHSCDALAYALDTVIYNKKYSA